MKFSAPSPAMTLEVNITNSATQDDQKKGEEDTLISLEEHQDIQDEPEQSPSKIRLFTLMGLSIVSLQVLFEVSKQISNYSMQYSNGGKYAVASTAIVVSIETLKILITLLRMESLPEINSQTLQSSIKYLVPGVLYTINNNIYFIGLSLVPPPIWLILCSSRTLITAFIYRVFLKRQLNLMQYLGIGCIVSSLVIAKAPDLMFYSVNQIPISAIGLAFLASCFSATAAIYTEVLFKSSGASNTLEESFLLKQFWLYAYGIVIASVFHFASNPSYGIGSYLADISKMDVYIFVVFLISLTCGSFGGITVASILKYLDNIVKEYSGSFANVITAILSSLLFPDKFQLSFYIILSMFSLIVGILLYETKKNVVK